MSSSVYDPRKFEFVARMGRIPGPNDDIQKRKEKIPVTFRIPDPPEQEIVTIPLGRSMRAEPYGESMNKEPPNLEDFLENLPPRACSEVKLTPEEQQKKNKLLEKMIEDRKKRAEERKLQHTAQHLVNEALLQNELEDLKKKEEMLHAAKSAKPQTQNNKMDMTNATIFHESQPPVNEELMKEIRKELERLVPVPEMEN